MIGITSQTSPGLSEITHTTIHTSATVAKEYLAFALGDMQYGVDIQKVQELRGYEAVTRLANAPVFLKGVINLRGNIVPIIDMRIQFGVQQPSYDQLTVVIILNIENHMVGIVVDSVSDVVNVVPEDIKPVSELWSSGITEYLVGMVALPDGLLMLVDFEQLISGEQYKLTN